MIINNYLLLFIITQYEIMRFHVMKLLPTLDLGPSGSGDPSGSDPGWGPIWGHDLDGSDLSVGRTQTI